MPQALEEYLAHGGFQQKHVGWADLQLPQAVLQPSHCSSVPQPRVRGWEGRRGKKRKKLQLCWGLNWIRRNWFLPFCLEFCEKTVLLRLSVWQNHCSQKGCERKLNVLSHFVAINHCSVTKSDSWRPHGLQHTRLLCPSSSPRACSNSGPLSRWRHPTTSSFVVSFSSCPQSFPAWGSFPVSQLFPSGGQSTGASASASIFPVNIQGWFPLGWTGLIPLHLLQHHSYKASVLRCSAFFMPTLVRYKRLWNRGARIRRSQIAETSSLSPRQRLKTLAKGARLALREACGASCASRCKMNYSISWREHATPRSFLQVHSPSLTVM